MPTINQLVQKGEVGKPERSMGHCQPCHLFGVSLTYRRAPLELRERFSFSDLEGALAELRRLPIREVALLSTCNRTELYARLPSADPAPLLAWLAERGGMAPEELLSYLDLRWGREAVRHLFRVACGLDSMVLGEPQILGQLKAAYRMAKESGTTGELLDRLFQHAFRAAKRVRAETALGRHPLSIAYVAVRLAQRLFESFASKTALLVGAGEMIELVALHLRERGIGRIVIANRTKERAGELARRFGAEPIPLSSLPERLREADLLISCTASPLPILGKGAVEEAIKRRRHRPIFMVDLAVPRDIEPQVAELEDVYLYTLDDLEAIVQESGHLRRQAAGEAELLIEEEVDRFQKWLRLREEVDLICALRERGEVFKRKALRRAMRALRGGKSPEEALELLAHALTNQWLHFPSIAVREAAASERRELLAALKEIFRLEAFHQEGREDSHEMNNHEGDDDTSGSPTTREGP